MLQYCLVLLLGVPLLWFHASDAGLKIPERVEIFRLEMILLVFRLALGVSIGSWLHALCQQPRPCLCTNELGELVAFGGTHWGMPSDDVLVVTLVAYWIGERASPAAAYVMTILKVIAVVCVGDNSLGQALSGVFFGVILHLYLTKTPMLLRPLDMLVNVIIGPVVFMHSHSTMPDVDMGYSGYFFLGLCWQIFAFLMLMVFYDTAMLRRIASNSSSHLPSRYFGWALLKGQQHPDQHNGDASAASPLLRPSPRGPTSPRLIDAPLAAHSQLMVPYTSACVLVLFSTLVVVQSCYPYLNAVW